MENDLNNTMENTLEKTGLNYGDGFDRIMREIVTLSVKLTDLDSWKEEGEYVDIYTDRLIQLFAEGRNVDDADTNDVRITVEEIIKMVSRIYTRCSERMRNDLQELCIAE